MTVHVALSTGQKTIACQMPQANWLDSFVPAQVADLPNPDEAIAQALAQPLNRPRLRRLVRPGERVAIIVDDHTRATPAWRIIPWLAAELAVAGIPDEHIEIVIARGAHRACTEAEVLQKVGAEARRRFRVTQHDCQDEAQQTFIGLTSRGTPVWINRTVAQADRRLTIGHIAPSPYAGYSGGGKLIVPGVAALDTINFNHSFVPAGFRRHGAVDLPTRGDIDEAAALVGVDLEIDVVFDSQGRLAAALAGDPAGVFREGLALARPLNEVRLPGPVDIALASGEPFTLDLYQATRAVEYADAAVRPGGAILLLADCPDGVGGDEFYQLLAGDRQPAEFLRAASRRSLKVTFAVLGYALARIKAEKSVYVLTGHISDQALRAMGFKPCHDLQATVDELLAEYGPAAKVAAFPRGSVTIPILE
ncbi:MAG: nickel-dependent lactate racemase [Chloroflexota bacterium]